MGTRVVITQKPGIHGEFRAQRNARPEVGLNHARLGAFGADFPLPDRTIEPSLTLPMDVAATRRRLMRNLEVFPAEMTEVAARHASHRHLANPSVQYIYSYLTKLVLEVGQELTGK